MATKYQLRGNSIGITIGNLVYDKLGQEVLAKFNEKFRGIKGVEFSRQETPKRNEVVRYSNVPRALGIDQILREQFSGLSLRVLSPEQVARFWDFLPERSSTYADTNAIVVYPNQGANEELRQTVLKQIGITSKLPLIVTGLGVEPDNSSGLGFTLTRTDYTQAQEAEFLTADRIFSYNATKRKLEKLENGFQVYTPNEQSGLRRLCRNWDDSLVARGDVLLGGVEVGRVQLIQGKPEDLERLARGL